FPILSVLLKRVMCCVGWRTESGSDLQYWCGQVSPLWLSHKNTEYANPNAPGVPTGTEGSSAFRASSEGLVTRPSPGSSLNLR
ncbi:MAG: hypothetical protein ACE5K1_12520, partial [Acidiferrobacterales bacterium]